MQSFLLLLGVFACSTSVLWIKQSHIDPFLLTALRLSIAAVVLTPLFIRDFRKHRDMLTRQHFITPLIPGVVLAIHFFGWIVGARLTTSVNAILLVNLAPVAMPFLLYWLASEKINRTELAATGITLAGLMLLFFADFHLSADHFRGDVICLAAMVLLAVYLALARRYRQHPTIWLYVVPLYYYAAAIAFAAVPFVASDAEIDWARELPLVLALALIPTVIGHSLLSNAMRYIRGQVVSLASMMQFAFAGVLGYFFLGESSPNWTFYPACSLFLTAGAMVVLSRTPAPVAAPSAAATKP